MLRPEIMVTVTFLLNSNTIGLHQKYKKKTLLLKSLNLPHSVMHFKTGDDMMTSSYSVARKTSTNVPGRPEISSILSIVIFKIFNLEFQNELIIPMNLLVNSFHQ